MGTHIARRTGSGSDATGRRRRRWSSRRAGGLAVAVATAAGAGVAAPPAAATPSCSYASYDFDEDARSDQVVAAPGGEAGTVEVRLSNDGTAVDAVLTGPPGFGTAVTQLRSTGVEVDERLCTQLVVGSPDETVAGEERAGAVYVYTFDPDQEAFELRARYTAASPGVPGAPQAGARFGASLTSDAFQDDVVDPEPQPLWVGAPGQDVAGVRDAGRVTSFTVTAEDTTAREGALLSLATPGMPGSPSEGAAFGSAISERGAVLAVGAPRQRGGGADRTGAVLLWLMPTYTNPDRSEPFLLHQGTPGVPGSPETGDRFGAAVHLAPAGTSPAPPWGPTDLVVGVPGEDLGDVADAGRVVVAEIDSQGEPPIGTFRAWDQDSASTDGIAEQGDAFGAAVSSGFVDGRWRVVVGTPQEDVGAVPDTGMVQVLGVPGASWHPDSPGIPGTAEAGDRMGAALSPDVSIRTGRLPAVGLPGKDEGRGGVLSGLPVGGATVTLRTGQAPDGAYGLAVAP